MESFLKIMDAGIAAVDTSCLGSHFKWKLWAFCLSLESEDEEFDQRNASLALQSIHRFSKAVRLETILGYFDVEEDRSRGKDVFRKVDAAWQFQRRESNLEELDDGTWYFANTAIFDVDGPIPQTIKIGGVLRLRDRDKNRLITTRTSAGVVTNNVGQGSYGLDEVYEALFVQDEIHATEKFLILPGIRMEHVEQELDATGMDSEESTAVDWNPSLHLLYRLRPDLSLRAAASRGVNRPRFDNLAPGTVERGMEFVLGNPSLQPAESWNYDFGAEYASGIAELGINLFHRDISGVLEEVDTGRRQSGKPILEALNVGDGWLRGIELEQRLRFGWTGVTALKGFSLWSNQSFLESEVRDSLDRDRPFREQPHFLANLGADYEILNWGTTFTVAWNHVGRQEDFTWTDRKRYIEPMGRLDASVRQKVGEHFSLFCEATNLTDAPREEIQRFFDGSSSHLKETNGRTHFLGVEWQF